MKITEYRCVRAEETAGIIVQILNEEFAVDLDSGLLWR
jgi:hypothetical protein